MVAHKKLKPLFDCTSLKSQSNLYDILLYTGVITSIADRLAPMKTVTCRRRASDVWFDDECRAAH